MIALLRLHLNRFSRVLAMNAGATRANTNIPLTMLRYSRGMDLQTSPFPVLTPPLKVHASLAFHTR